MDNAREIIEAIECGGILDRDGWLGIFYDGYEADYVYSIDSNLIFIENKGHSLIDWLRSVQDNKHWTFQWVNR